MEKKLYILDEKGHKILKEPSNKEKIYTNIQNGSLLRMESFD